MQNPMLTTQDFENAVLAHRANKPTTVETATTRSWPLFRPQHVSPARILPALAGSSTTFEITIPVPAVLTIVRVPTPPKGEQPDQIVGRRLPMTERGICLAHQHPGVYVIRHELGGGYASDYAIASIPNAAYAAMGPWSGFFDHALSMAALLNDPRATLANVIAALESGGSCPMPRFFGPNEGVNIASFRCGEPVAA